MLSLTQHDLPPGWILVPENTPVKTFDQYYSYMDNDWKLGSFWTSEGYIHRGKAPYRRPVSLRAYLTVAGPFVVKAYRALRAKVTGQPY